MCSGGGLYDQRFVFWGENTTNGVEDPPEQFVGLVFDTVVCSPSPPGPVGSLSREGHRLATRISHLASRNS